MTLDINCCTFLLKIPRKNFQEFFQYHMSVEKIFLKFNKKSMLTDLFMLITSKKNCLPFFFIHLYKCRFMHTLFHIQIYNFNELSSFFFHLSIFPVNNIHRLYVSTSEAQLLWTTLSISSKNDGHIDGILLTVMSADPTIYY